MIGERGRCSFYDLGLAVEDEQGSLDWQAAALTSCI